MHVSYITNVTAIFAHAWLFVICSRLIDQLSEQRRQADELRRAKDRVSHVHLDETASLTSAVVLLHLQRHRKLMNIDCVAISGILLLSFIRVYFFHFSR